MPRHFMCRFRPRRRGAAAVELALLLPFMAFAFVSAVDFGRVFYYSVTVEQCARNGAAFATTGPDVFHSSSYPDNIKNAAKRDASNLNLTQLTIDVATDGQKTSPSREPTYMDVTATYSFTTVTQYPGIP